MSETVTGYANGKQNQMLKNTIKIHAIILTMYPSAPGIQKGPLGIFDRLVNTFGRMARR